MLLRILIAVGPKRIQNRLCKDKVFSDTIMETLAVTDHLWEELGSKNADLAIIDRAFIPEPAGQSIQFIRHLPEAPEMVVFSDQENAEDRAGLLAAGCEAVLNTQLPWSSLQETLSAILRRKRLRSMDDLTRSQLSAQARLSDFVSYSAAMQAFMKIVFRVVNSNASLLICGETGVGKERLARAIHGEGPYGAGPFVAVNCGALPESLLESELFGHEEGAFTGALRSRRGCFELAHQGTIFLDEITEMPVHLQVKLLRVLQEQEIQPVGAEKSIKVQVRVMASTNRNLEEEVQAKRFRKDLYYRLSVVTLTIPALRERREDIPLLAQGYIDFLRSRIGSGSYAVKPEVMGALCDYSWPGNVRELINVLERAMLLCNRDEITLEDLPESIGKRPVTVGSDPLPQEVAALSNLTEDWTDHPWRTIRRKSLDLLERKYLESLLSKSSGRIGETAQRAGMSPRFLFDKMKKYRLNKDDFKYNMTKSQKIVT